MRTNSFSSPNLTVAGETPSSPGWNVGLMDAIIISTFFGLREMVHSTYSVSTGRKGEATQDEVTNQAGRYEFIGLHVGIMSSVTVSPFKMSLIICRVLFVFFSDQLHHGTWFPFIPDSSSFLGSSSLSTMAFDFQ
ncbi:unnamed protein product [Dicrocoelium dendriticum]|nr:unnamed protein product [Dicrocoelium dendriticum]